MKSKKSQQAARRATTADHATAIIGIACDSDRATANETEHRKKAGKLPDARLRMLQLHEASEACVCEGR